MFHIVDTNSTCCTGRSEESTSLRACSQRDDVALAGALLERCSDSRTDRRWGCYIRSNYHRYRIYT